MEWFKSKISVQDVELLGISDEIESKRLQLPLYQRDKVWSEGRLCAIWDTLLRGYPLPSFLLVQGEGKSRYFSDGTEETTTEYYDVLDGQQRLNAILAGEGKDPNIRLWIDVAPPPSEKKVHPLNFKFWIHPCTKIFPFGFNMTAGGEYDFGILSDSDLRKTKEKWREQRENINKRCSYHLAFKEDSSFPCKANCPVPLVELLAIARESNADNFSYKINELSGIIRKKFDNKFVDPDSDTIKLLSKGLGRLKNARLVFQLVDLQELDGEDGGYTLFERIGRSGVQISSRQLAVSKIMLVLGKQGYNALKKIQESRYGELLTTEDIIHAIVRVSLTNVLEMQGKDKEEALKQCPDLLDFNAVNLQKIKNNYKEIWKELINLLSSYCEPNGENEGTTTLIRQTLDRLFTLLRYDADNNPYGYPLVQLAHSRTRRGEGIEPLTLHPILFWLFKYKNSPGEEVRENMLRWIMFANGLVAVTKKSKLNRLALKNTGAKFFSVTELLNKYLEKDNKRKYQDLGLQWELPEITDNNVVSSKHNLEGIPTPQDVISLAISRLLLWNWSETAVNNFILLWNQREAMEIMYGGEDQYIPALFSKGRPFDLDHIVARSRLFGADKDLFAGDPEEQIRKGCEYFFEDTTLMNTVSLTPTNFRLYFSSLNGNYRYWPKRMNRQDSNKPVRQKMSEDNFFKQLEGDGQFGNPDPWQWSAMPEDMKGDWEALPPDNKWSGELVKKFIMVVFNREFFLYENAYFFVTNTEPEKCKTECTLEGIIKPTIKLTTPHKEYSGN